METAILGGGCYWCLDAIYRRVNGVETVESGYSGGHTENPSVNDVYAGDTGHAEVIQLVFDPSVITYRDILEIFFVMHNPTTLNRQDYDMGDEYRSIILYTNEDQRQTAEDMAQGFAADLWPDPVVTQILPFEKFWIATADMQDFYSKRPNVGYCQVIINPKIQNYVKNSAQSSNPKATRTSVNVSVSGILNLCYVIECRH